MCIYICARRRSMMTCSVCVCVCVCLWVCDEGQPLSGTLTEE